MYKLIGDDRQAAIDWLQDRLVITRPEAERAMIKMLSEKIAITTDQGIFLTEEEEEAEEKGKKFVQKARTRKPIRKQSKIIHKLEKQYNSKAFKNDDEDDDSK